MYSQHLKIKVASLAAEARIIRDVERRRLRSARSLKKKQQGQKSERDYGVYRSLRAHRLLVVRPAARAAHLADALLRGVPYLKVEHFCRTQPDQDAIAKNVARFSPDVTIAVAKTQVKSWLGSTNRNERVKWFGETMVAQAA